MFVLLIQTTLLQLRENLLLEVFDLALLAAVVELVCIFLSEVVVIIILRPIVISRVNRRVFVNLRVLDQVNTHIHVLHATVLAF